MHRERKYQGLLRHLYLHWPRYLFLYSGMVGFLLLTAVSALQNRLGLYLLSALLFMAFGYLLFAGLWAAHKLHDRDELQPHHVLFNMSQLPTKGQMLYINLGLRHRALALGRRLTTGKAFVVDVYNPQLTPSGAVKRGRARRPAILADPRFEWLDGTITLLPLPDESVHAAFLPQILSEFWQEGDRLTLLKEIYRVLPQNGRLLIAEQVQSRINWLTLGPWALTLKPAAYWTTLLNQAGFIVRKEVDLQGYILCIRAEKPTFAEAYQMALQFEFSGESTHERRL